MSKHRLLNNFQRVYRVDRWFRQRFTNTGWLVLGSLVSAAVLGADTKRTLAYQIFSVLFVVLIIAWLHTLRFRCRLSVQRIVPKFATVGEIFNYQLQITNPTQQVLSGFYYQEYSPTNFPTAEKFRKFRVIEDRQRNWFDRKVGYPKWIQLVKQQQTAEMVEHALPMITPGTTIIKAQLTPLRRGCLKLQALRFLSLEPFGIMKAQALIECVDIIWVFPKYYPVPAYHSAGGRRYQAGGVSLASTVGESSEFISLRDYRDGDSLRHIHWPSWAKTGKPIVKEYHDEFFTRYGVILDTFTEPGQQFEALVSTAASFVYAIPDQDALLDLMFVGEEAYRFTSGRGVAHIEQILRILASVEANPTQKFQRLSDAVLDHIEALSECICIFSAWDNTRQTLASMLQQYQVPIIILLVMPAPQLHQMGQLPLHVHPIDAENLEADLQALQL